MTAKTEHKSYNIPEKPEPLKDTPQNQIRDNPVAPGQKKENAGNILPFSTRPERTSFVYKYLMALSPIPLVILSFYTRMLLENLFKFGSSSVTSAVSNTMPNIVSNYTNSALSLNQYASPINYASSLTILMIAPVGIFIFFAATGWTLRLTELWSSTSLTIVMSSIAGVIMAGLGGVSPTVSSNYLLLLLQWIAYMVQPFCVVAAVIVIIATEKFRRSITYTITQDGLWMRGGLLFMQEHMLPHHQIGRIVGEQDFLGKMFNYGTLIPLSMTRWGEETSFRAIGASGQKDNFGVGIGFAKGREEGSRYPLDCLYGIPDPKRVQNIITELICRHDKREDDQIAYLKKIYEIHVAKTMTNNEANITPNEGVIPTDKDPEPRESCIIRINDIDIPRTTTSSADGNVREIPPLVINKSNPPKEIPPPEPVLDTIKKLADLKNSGVITEEEFNLKKTELLKRL